MKLKRLVRKIIIKLYRHIHNSILRIRLKNEKFTILAPTCIAGKIYHYLGKQFLSPTINLWLTEDDFYKFVNNLNYYIEQEVEYFKEDETNKFPIGIIKGITKEDDILINFNHDTDFERAKADWDNRKKRIDWDNIWVIASTHYGESQEKIERYEKLMRKVKGLVVFTAKDYPQYSYTLQLKKYKNEECVGQYMIDCPSNILDKKPWEYGFNYVKWLNTGKLK